VPGEAAECEAAQGPMQALWDSWREQGGGPSACIRARRCNDQCVAAVLTLMRPAVQGHQPEITSERDVADRLEAEGK